MKLYRTSLALALLLSHLAQAAESPALDAGAIAVIVEAQADIRPSETAGVAEAEDANAEVAESPDQAPRLKRMFYTAEHRQYLDDIRWGPLAFQHLEVVEPDPEPPKPKAAAPTPKPRGLIQRSGRVIHRW